MSSAEKADCQWSFCSEDNFANASFLEKTIVLSAKNTIWQCSILVKTILPKITILSLSICIGKGTILEMTGMNAEKR